MRRNKQEESGAYAVLFGLLVVVLVGISALAVDLGNAISRDADVQAQADFAALAGARESDGNLSGPVAAVIVDQVRDYLNDNHPLDQACGTECVNSAQLINGDLADGEVRYANGGIQVHTPFENVQYGLAGVLGTTDKDVQADATVGLFSPDFGMMPVYAVNPCDYGRQTITDPSNGHLVPPEVPPLSYPADTNETDLENVTPNQLDVNAPSVELTLTGRQWTNTVRVGFFPDDGGAPVVATQFIDSANIVHPHDPPLVPYTTTGNAQGSVRVVVPAAVAGSERVWYLRVFNLTSPIPPADPNPPGTWSLMSNAQPIRVGQAVLECDAGASDGNFGALRLVRSDTSSMIDELAKNMADGLERPLTLTKHLQWTSTGLCSHGDNQAVESDLPNPGQNPKTNCVDTDTGLPANAATAGLVTGEHIGVPGRLDADTTPGCDPANGEAEATVTLNHTSYSINNDVLTCFLTDTTTSLADITSPTYSGGEVLDPSILDSPRFSLVPILHVEPNSGGSNRYSIVDFRPAFLTDEAPTITATKGNSNATTENGIYIDQNQVKQVKVVFFHFDALTLDTEGDVIDYIGVGEPILRLID